LSATASRISTTIAGALIRVAFGHQSVYHRCSASDAVLNGYRIEGTVLRACTAFHAIIKSNNFCATVVHGENTVRADLYASPAAGAFLGRKFQG
jgi:hypothetical protein